MYHIILHLFVVVQQIFIYLIAGVLITYVNLSRNEFFVCDTVKYDTSMYIFYCF